MVCALAEAGGGDNARGAAACSEALWLRLLRPASASAALSWWLERWLLRWLLRWLEACGAASGSLPAYALAATLAAPEGNTAAWWRLLLLRCEWPAALVGTEPVGRGGGGWLPAALGSWWLWWWLRWLLWRLGLGLEAACAALGSWWRLRWLLWRLGLGLEAGRAALALCLPALGSSSARLLLGARLGGAEAPAWDVACTGAPLPQAAGP